MYKNKTFRHHQYTISTDWPGGVYGSPSVNGSRAGGIIAACWAAMMHFGYDGYVSTTRKIIDTTRYIEAELVDLLSCKLMKKLITNLILLNCFLD